MDFDSGGGDCLGVGGLKLGGLAGDGGNLGDGEWDPGGV